MFLEKIRVADFRLLMFLKRTYEMLMFLCSRVSENFILRPLPVPLFRTRFRHLACRGLQARAPSGRQIAVLPTRFVIEPKKCTKYTHSLHQARGIVNLQHG